jgi:hypothetical protein
VAVTADGETAAETDIQLSMSINARKDFMGANAD